MPFVHVNNDNPYNNGGIVDSLPSNIEEGSEFLDTVSGDTYVFLQGSWSKIVSNIQNSIAQAVQVLENNLFKEKLGELALFDIVSKNRYFQIKNLYKSDDVNNRILASKIVLGLHKEMTG